MTNHPQLLFLGNESLSTCPDYDQTPIFNRLLAEGWPIEAVIIKHQPAVSRKKAEPTISRAAQKAGVDLIVVKDKNELRAAVDRYPAGLGLLASFGLIIPEDILEQFPLGLINVHPSLLPAYRGTTPIESVIADGQTKTGVSLIKTTVDMDGGPIYAQQSLDIDPQISKLKLTGMLGELAADLTAKQLPLIAKGSLKPQKQDESQASYTRPLGPKDRPIEWNQPAEKIERQVRAQAGWPGSTIKLAGQTVKVIEVVLLDKETPGSPGKFGFDNTSNLITIDCQVGQVGLRSIQVPGKRPTTADDFRNRHHDLDWA